MEFYNPFDAMTFTYDRCFMCGELLDSNNRADEHVYPRWLQREFNLWNQRLVLLNKTEIQYKRLTIPCCNECNNEHLNKKVESKVEKAVKGGYEEFINLDEEIVFKWLNKIAYGMLFKELSLRSFLQDINSEPIYSKEQLEEHKMQFTFLQSIRFNTEFIAGKPWSILVFKVKNPNDKKTYNSMDFLLQKCFFMQLNDIGIISCLMDNGSQKEYFLEHLSDFLDIELHCIQFAELCAKFLTKATLFFRTPHYTIKMPKDLKDTMQIISHEISGVLFSDWSQELYARMLEYFFKPWCIPYEKIYIDNEHVITFLRNEDGTIKTIHD